MGFYTVVEMGEQGDRKGALVQRLEAPGGEGGRGEGGREVRLGSSWVGGGVDQAC